jgi:hypothetical protein
MLVCLIVVLKSEIRDIVETELMAKLAQKYATHDWSQFHTCLNVIRYLELDKLAGFQKYGMLSATVRYQCCIMNIIHIGAFYPLVAGIATVEAV